MKIPDSRPDPNAGFSLVEAVLASALFGLLITALVGAYLYGEESFALAGNRARASMLAKEGLEASRNLRDATFSGLPAGVQGLAISASQWNFSGSSDATGIFTRSVSIATVDANRKDVTSTVTWQQNQSRTGTVSLVTRFTNFLQSIGGWAAPFVAATLDFAGTQDGLKIQTAGGYAYIVRNDGTPDFLVVDVSNPASPNLVASLSLPDVPTNIALSGNFAYVSSQNNAQELQIIDISNPLAPSVAGTYNALGNADALGVYAVGTTVYLVRATSAQDEFLIIDASTPAVPLLIGSLNLGANGYEVFVTGTHAYVASGVNNAELQVVDVSIPLLASIVGTVDLPGNPDASTVAGQTGFLFLGRETNVYVFDITTPASPSLVSTFAGAGTVNDIALNFGNAGTFIYFVTANSNKEFEVFDITVPSAPVTVGGLNLTTLNGIAYDAALDHAFAVGAEDAQELIIIGPQP